MSLTSTAVRSNDTPGSRITAYDISNGALHKRFLMSWNLGSAADNALLKSEEGCIGMLTSAIVDGMVGSGRFFLREFRVRVDTAFSSAKTQLVQLNRVRGGVTTPLLKTTTVDSIVQNKIGVGADVAVALGTNNDFKVFPRASFVDGWESLDFQEGDVLNIVTSSTTSTPGATGVRFQAVFCEADVLDQPNGVLAP